MIDLANSISLTVGSVPPGTGGVAVVLLLELLTPVVAVAEEVVLLGLLLLLALEATGMDIAWDIALAKLAITSS